MFGNQFDDRPWYQWPGLLLLLIDYVIPPGRYACVRRAAAEYNCSSQSGQGRRVQTGQFKLLLFSECSVVSTDGFTTRSISPGPRGARSIKLYNTIANKMNKFIGLIIKKFFLNY